MCQKKVVITNFSQQNMSFLIQLAYRYDSEILLKNQQWHVNAKSLMGVMAFHPALGSAISIVTHGVDEFEAADAVEAFFTMPHPQTAIKTIKEMFYHDERSRHP